MRPPSPGTAIPTKCPMRRALTTSLLILLVVADAFGQQPTDPPKGAITESADEIATQIDELELRRTAPRDYGMFEPYLDRWDALWGRVDSALGLNLGFAYTTLFQAASNGNHSGPRSGGAGDLDIFGRWSLFGRKSPGSWLNEGMFGFNLEYRHRIGPTTPAELGASLGSLWNTTTGFNEQDLSLIQWWWQQKLFGESLTIRAGELDLSSIFDAYRFNSANFFFQNQAFSDNPTIPFPENGLGVVGAWYPTERWFIILGTGDAEGRKTATISESKQNTDAWFSAATAGRRGPVGRLGEGLYQVTVWHTDKRSKSPRPSATGFSFVAQQELGNGWVPYARYAHSSDRATDTRRLITAGAVYEGDSRNIGDRFGLSVGWGQPHDRHLRSQWVGEIFYRSEPLRKLQVTPTVQIILNPSKNRADDVIAIYGIRARLNF